MVIDRLQRMIIYWRLRRVDMRLTGYLDTSHEASSVSLRQMLLNDDVEAAIYRTLISILNRYPAVSHDGALRDSIHRLVSRNPSYDDLVKGLACL